MDYQVPWRCLVPADAVSFIIGKGGVNIRQMCDTSGAELAISKDGETPDTLADKIVTISGLVDQKENACGQVIRKLRQMQGVEDHEPGVFVIVIPQSSAPVIIGAKGAQIKSIMEQSGAEINVGREAIIGMADQPISINGTLDQVVSAISKLNAVLQDMVDRGRLKQQDFIFRPQQNGAGDLSSGAGGGYGCAAAAPVSAPAPEAPGLGGCGCAPAMGGGGFSAPAGGGGCAGSLGNSSHQAPAPTPATAQGTFGGQAAGGGFGAAAAPTQTSFGGTPAGGFGCGGGGNGTSFGMGGGCGGQQQAQPQQQQQQQQQASFGGGQNGGCGGQQQAQQQQASFGGGQNGGAGGSSFGGQQGVFGGGMGGMGAMGGMGGGMGAMGTMGGMGGGMGFGGMNPMMGGMGFGNPMMGGLGGMGIGMGMVSGNERAFMAALQASGINNSQLTLLMPQPLIQNILVPRGIMAEIAQRSGAKIDLGAESPAGMRQVTLSGPMVANALATLFLQEQAIQFQQMMG